MEAIEEQRKYKDNNDPLTALWETANTIAPGKMLIRDREGHAEVMIQWVLTETKASKE